MLQPDGNWRWYFDTDQQCLALAMGEMVFVSPYQAKVLGRVPQQHEAFDLQDLEIYGQVSAALDCTTLELCAVRKTQLALNVCAVQRYHKPLMPKSWFFSRHANFGHHHQVAWLRSSLQQARVWVVEDSHSSCLCMNLEPHFELGNGKSLKQFALIRVTPDCLLPCVELQERLKRA